MLTFRSVALRIRDKRLRGQTEPDQYLPGERDLASEYGVSRMTVRRALKTLAAEGLIRAERGHGYRVLLRSVGDRPGSPVVFVTKRDYRRPGPAGDLASIVQQFLVRSDSQVMTLGVGRRSPEAVLRAISDAGAWGVLVEGGNRDLHVLLRESGLPCVAVDDLTTDLGLDCVLQDNFGGAQAAAEYLIRSGHRRIAWFGDVARSNHSLERYAGAHSAFVKHGVEFRQELVVDSAMGETVLRKLLARRERPTAVLSMWRGHTLTVVRAARALGLRMGVDIDIVGWTTADDHQHLMSAEFPGGDAPAMVVWDHRTMARVALDRVEQRRQCPDLSAVKLTVPARLVPPASQTRAREER
jgi:DNA-binding LacI/PurR family transcriptional regulator